VPFPPSIPAQTGLDLGSPALLYPWHFSFLSFPLSANTTSNSSLESYPSVRLLPVPPLSFPQFFWSAPYSSIIQVKRTPPPASSRSYLIIYFWSFKVILSLHGMPAFLPIGTSPQSFHFSQFPPPLEQRTFSIPQPLKLESICLAPPLSLLAITFSFLVQKGAVLERSSPFSSERPCRTLPFFRRFSSSPSTYSVRTDTLFLLLTFFKNDFNFLPFLSPFPPLHEHPLFPPMIFFVLLMRGSQWYLPPCKA